MEVKEMLVQQGNNLINSMKDLKRIAHKKGKERFEQFERFSANKHSFKVYLNVDAVVSQTEEVQSFLKNLQRFSDFFEPIRYDFEGEVQVNQVEENYQPVLEAYNKMVTVLGYEKEIINVKRF